jgi:hypothetical protein
MKHGAFGSGIKSVSCAGPGGFQKRLAKQQEYNRERNEQRTRCLRCQRGRIEQTPNHTLYCTEGRIWRKDCTVCTNPGR